MHYAWMDLETTGLDDRIESILEVGIAITDDQGNKLDLVPFAGAIPDFKIVDNVVSVVLELPAHYTERAHERVREMHDHTGLSRDALKSHVTALSVEAQICQLLDEMKLGPKDLTIAGNTIHFDWRFLRRHMPEIIEKLHYRQLDMSSVALFADTMGLPRPPKGEAHRVVADINESLAYFRFYREHLKIV